MGRKGLAAILGMASMAMATPQLQAEQDSAPPPKAENKSWYAKAWDYTGGAVGWTVSAAGVGVEKVGSGIGWTMDKVTKPVRWAGEGVKWVGDRLAEGPLWVEQKTGVPMATVSGIVAAPGNMVYSITDNSSDLLTEAPQASLGVAGATMDTVGKIVSADGSGIVKSAKNVGSHTVDLGKTAIGDAGPLALHAVGGVTALSLIPVDAVARDVIAGGNRITDVITEGKSDLSKNVPQDLFHAGVYTYHRIADGKKVADEKYNPAPKPQMLAMIKAKGGR